MKFKQSKNNKRYHGSKPAIVFYVLAILFLIYGAYMIYTVYDYLVDYYASYSMGMWDDVANTIQYFVSNSSSYFVYAVLCYGVGMILQTIHDLKNHIILKEVETEEEELQEAEDVVVDSTIEYNTKEKKA